MRDFDVREELILGDDQDVITTEQFIGDDLWNDLAEAKDNFQFRLNGLTPVASIPEALVNKWLREGFDVWSAPANEIKRKLRIDGYEVFDISGDKTFDQ
jgi:hypothetical protein